MEAKSWYYDKAESRHVKNWSESVKNGVTPVPSQWWSSSYFTIILIVPRFSPTSFCIHTKRISYQSLLSTGKKHLASRFNLTYRYIDDVLSINNPEFENYLGQMYPAELEIKDTTESTTSASYLDLLLSIGRDGQLHTSIYDKRDDFNFHITNFPFLSSNIPSFRQPMEFLSLNLYDTPGLAPRMNVLYWGPGDFPVSYSNRDTSRNAWNRHSGSFMVDMGILFSNMKYPSHEC